jgi:hypothetical protein
MSGVAPPDDAPSYYIYKPAHGVSIAFAVLFAISGFAHIWQNNLKYRSYRIGFLLPWASLIFTAGFILREYGSYHTDNLDIFIASQVLLFVAPPVYNGANYFIFGRALYYLPYLSPIHPGRVWSTFITLDGIADIIAANGAIRATNADATDAERRAGLDLVKISLFLLLGMFLAFMFLNIQFHYRAHKMGVFSYKMKVIVYELYASNLLILLRNCFRTAVFFLPWNNIAHSQEWPLWVFEAVPMLINSYLMNIYPPAKYIPANHKVYLAMDGKTEIEGPGMIDKRPLLVTIVDPFDVWGILKKKDQKNRYWLKDGIGGPLPGVQAGTQETADAGDEVTVQKTAV